MKANHTKNLLAESLIRLMSKAPLDSISVTDIANDCDLNRHTFYYHFKDKQDLVCWIFDRDITEHQKMPPLDGSSLDKDAFFVRDIIQYMYSNKVFYINALNSTAQNSLQDHLFKHIRAFREVQIESVLNGRVIDDVCRDFIADYFSNAMSGFIVRWSKDGMRDQSKIFFPGFKNVAYRCMQFLLDNYIEDQAL